MENYKSLQAYQYFISGWVQTIKHIHFPGGVVFFADVRPSYRTTEEPYHPWVAVAKSGKVVAGHCTCMAGLGETCSHVAAILYKVEAAVRQGLTHTTPTDLPCQWNQNFTRNVKAFKICDIIFYSHKGKSPIKSYTRNDMLPATSQEQSAFLADLSTESKKVVGLSLFEEHQDAFVVNEPPPVQRKLPSSLLDLYVGNKTFSPKELEIECDKVIKNLKYSESDLCYIEEATRNQATSSTWYQQRAGRITGSIIHSVLHTNETNPAKILMDKICQKKILSLNVTSLKWGRDHEHEALLLFQEISTSDTVNNIVVLGDPETHTDFECKDVGLCVHPEHPRRGFRLGQPCHAT
ncbi:uncharacterized protein LOC130648858 [Hydractinia symbiolongicarpus]|uniref:uncharacterized protein LOC130648858 n=1 Tax=Hydractinia symbiolongicarpus TaxID=13093 RepID=UPI00254C2B21|nr:uncharacterized protein LOC130648858 [Hydractinia symbiolongicarpus]